MAQTTTTSGYLGLVAAPVRNVGAGLLIAWQRTTASGNFFTIGSSVIGGSDMIKSSGQYPAFFDKFVYKDYSSYILSMSVSKKLGQFTFGVVLSQLDVELDNTSKLFLPGFDPTIGSGILPNRPIKASMSIGGESLPQFTGFTGQPENTILNRKTTLHAYDIINYINTYSFTASGTTISGITTSSGYLANVYADEIMDYYLRQMGLSSTQFVLDHSLQQKIGYVSITDKKFGETIQGLVEAEQGLFFADENGLPRFWNRQHFLTTSGLGRAFSLDYNNIISLDYDNAPIINDVIVRAKPRAIQPKQKVWQLQGSVSIPPQGTKAIFADFQDDFGDLVCTSVDTPVYVSGATTSFYSTNASSDGSGAANNASISIKSIYLFGKTYLVTFANSSAAEIFITNMTLYGTPAKVNQVIEQRYTDFNSVLTLGRNPSNNGDPYEISNDYIQDSSTAYSLAYTLVNEYSVPQRRYIARVFADPARQIGDYGTLTNPDTSETKNVYITGIINTMGRNGDLQQQLTLEERVIRSYFTIGTSTIGGSDMIAP